jgi:uncharacterized heparinase superfamily protein
VQGHSRSAIARFHVSPQWSVHLKGLMAGHLVHNDGQVVTFSVGAGQLRLEPSTYHPEFGASVPNQCICVELVDGSAQIEFSWRCVE